MTEQIALEETACQHLPPLEVAEKLLGGLAAVSRIAGRSEKVGYQWRHKNYTRQPGDLPSADVMRKLLAYSDRHGRGLKPEHLIWGAPAAEIEALLEQMRARPAPGIEAAE
ncbi:hypothetical protein PARHAE_01106 [Paracoccus haematequi]|uniref:Uncharacterized protein n=1 Tax=Paracoccus haematequi TaxID=2491866 RepID=A0A3S4EQW4_9RHOB|nr:hypothetical protein PARHAE_01106 [Paracoccus haematequi]